MIPGRARPPGVWRGIAALVAFGLTPIDAAAHVKWFCSGADVTQAPLALTELLTPLFGAICGSFVMMVFAGFLLDGAIARRWPDFAAAGTPNVALEEKLVRLAIGAYFLLLWDKGAVVLWENGDALLTPELTAGLSFMGLVQLGIAVAVTWRRTCGLAAAGIVFLYGYGIKQFGVFHMIDYIFFCGIAAYLGIISVGRGWALHLRVPLLTGGLAFGLMWTAVEKFVYPGWTFDVVAQHPDLTFGFPLPFSVVVAGFVEFTLAFYIVTGRGLVRVGAASYAAIFLAAVPEFGHLDAVGHLPILAILAVVCVHGAPPFQRAVGLAKRSDPTVAAAITLVYVTCLAGFFVAYYGLHRIEYG